MPKLNLLLQATVCLGISVFSGGCKDDKSSANMESVPAQTAQAPASPEMPQGMSFNSLESKSFEINDSITGKSLGWGYDIYAEGKRMIHQPIIPAIAGNNHFKSKEAADKTAALAISKMQRSGSLPILTIEELDSLGVTK
jgi:hypothetical protein